MSSNKRRTLAIKVETPGGDNPLTLQLVGKGPFFRGIAVSNLSLVAKGGTAPYAFSIISGSINGLTLNTDGTFSGSGDDSGRFAFVAQVSDSSGQVFTHSFSLTFNARLFVVAGTPTPGELGVAYRYQFVVRDASGITITSGYTLLSGNFPAGLSITGAGLLHGLPTAPDGISYFVLSVTDGVDSIKIPCKITIFPELGGYYLEDIDPPADQGGGAGSWLPAMVRNQDWIAHLVPTGGVPPYSITASTGSPPPTGIKVDSSRRIVYGRTTDSAQIDPRLMSVWITDALGKLYTVQRALFIIEQPNARVIPRRNGTDVSNAGGFATFNLEEGDGVSIDASATGDGVSYRISADASPSGGVSTINGVHADSNGDLEIDGIGVDSNGRLVVDFPTTNDQPSIQWQDEGVNQGTPGSITTINVSGAGGSFTDTGGGIGLLALPGTTPTLVQNYSTAGSFTWTKPSGAQYVQIVIVGGGGGGGSGSGSNASNGGSAGGGGAGAKLHLTLDASSLGSTENVTVGAAGTGGASVTSTLVGNPGVTGGTSSFASKYFAFGGGGGAAGQNGSVGGGGGGGIWSAGGVGGTSGSTAGAGGGIANAIASPDGGDNEKIYGGAAGGGGRVSALAVAPKGGRAVDGPSGGGSGGIGNINQTGGQAYDGLGNLNVNGGTAGNPGSTVSGIATNLQGAGGGGGGGKTSGGAAPGKGGAGQQPGGGGGGGGGTNINAQASGAGGDGGVGYVQITTFF